MDAFSSDLIGIIYHLLPGFLVAWILYGLTAYLKPQPFERVVQALIFTIVVQALIIIVRKITLFIGNYIVLGFWDKDVELIWSLLIAIFLGLFLSWCVNNDFPLYLLRKDGKKRCHKLFAPFQALLSKLNLTNKTLHPSGY